MTDPFDAIDRKRIARHEQLLAIWRELAVEELCADLNILGQLIAFHQRQELLVVEARAGVKAGAGHECSEWVKDGMCQLCGRAVLSEG